MPKRVINALNAGELSPYLYARSDIEKYDSGCLVMENFVPLPYGGAVRRPALKYDGDSKQDDKIRLVPFTASVENSFVLEFGDQYIRIWQDGSLVTDGVDTIELETPYLEADLFEIKCAQSVDVMWLVHPEYQVKRLSRVSATEWKIEDEPFEFPPVLEGNDTDITLSPSATTGEITLTASRAFFDSGHVGGYFVMRSVRTSDESVDRLDSVNGDGFGEWINMSNSDWTFNTAGTWEGRVLLQRKEGSTGTPEDYIFVGDTVGATTDGRRNFSISSDEPESFGVYMRTRYIGVTNGLESELKPENRNIESLVKIVGYTSSTSVTAEVIGEFQDVPSDYSAWATSTAYTEGDKRYIDSGLSSSSTTDLTTISASLTNIEGSDFGGDKYWFVTDDGAGNVFLRKVNSALSSLDASYDLSTQFEAVYDVAFYANKLYVSGDPVGVFSDTRICSYSTSGVFDAVEKNFSTANACHGLGYYNGYFYDGRNTTNKPIRKYDSAFNSTGVTYSTGSADAQEDITGYNGRIYVANENNTSIDIYTEDLDLIDQIDVSADVGSDALVGMAHDGTNLCLVTSGDDLIKYDIEENRTYYECVQAHTSGSFATDYTSGYWSERNPATTDWSEGAFSDYRGHPAAVSLFESRLVYAGAEYAPDTIWLSKIDDFVDFGTGDLDTDGIRITLNSGQMNEIKWLVTQERLVIGTSGSEWSLGASDERKAITPTGFNLKRKTKYGSSGLQGILINSAVIFLMRQGRKVREWTPNYNIQDYVAPDLSILAEHITEGGITQWDFQQQPDNILWSIRDDGTLLGFTYERDQNVIGWHRHSNDEFEFESVAVIPKIDAEDEVWASVKIVVDGDTKRYIGRLDAREWGTDYTTEWQGSDLYKTYSSPGTATLTGLDYLEGETVSVIADGTILDDETVSGGSITIDSDAYSYVVVGLPFTSTVAPLYLVSENQYGTSKGTKIDNRHCVVRFKDTYSAKVGQSLARLEKAKFKADDSPLYNNDVIGKFDNASDWLLTVYVVQDEPMPCTVLAMIPEVEVR